MAHGTSLGPTSFYWASKLLRGTFWAPLKSFKTPRSSFRRPYRTSKCSAAAFEGVPPVMPWYLPRPHKLLLGFETCFYWASKLLRGTFWAPLKTLKTPAAAFEGLRTSKPSAAAFEGLLLLSGILDFFWALFFFKVRGVAGAAKHENQK